MTWIWQRIQEEPVAAAAIVRLSLSTAMVFGLQWTAEQVAAVMSLTEAVLMFLTRGAVTPNAKL